jgi:uncharacterized protein (TIGR04141 family)
VAEPFSTLTVYRLRDEVNGKRVTKFEDFIDPQKKTTHYSLRGRYNFQAGLFVAPPDEGPPSWLAPLKIGFGALEQIPDSINNSAVLIIKVRHHGRELHFAATFGFGRFLLRPGAFERNYGMRVALNAIYPKHKGKRLDSDRLRSVDSKTVGANTFRTRRQADRKADFETFDVDIERDLLSGLTGTPLDTRLWGTRIDGADALHLHRSVSFDQLGKICSQLEANSAKVPPEFSWVDNIFAVRDSALIEVLKQRIVEMIKSGEPRNLELAPPELVEWGDIDHFEFSFDANYSFAEPNIDEYIKRLRAKNKLADLSLGQLTAGHRLVALDAGAKQIGSWTIFRSLSGEIEHRSPSYIVSEGEFFEITSGYLDQLDGTLNKLREFAGDLPQSRPSWSEDRYNREASRDQNNLLLDKKTVRLTSRTAPIEVCDILTSRRQLIHVKRKLNSSSLSHLFAQGLVSADLLLMNEEFRQKVRQRIAPLERARHLGNRFSRLFPPNRGITARDFVVVYTIIARWKGRTLNEALPFFSKVNLRRCMHELVRMGYGVTYRRIAEGVAAD